MRPFEFYWPPQSINAIAVEQTLTAPGAVILTSPVFTYDKIVRSVSVTSTDNIEDILFTIQGTYQGKPISATITGVNNSTVDTSTGRYSSNWAFPPQLSATDIIFDTVTSVTASGDIGDFPITFSVGTGLYGRSAWVNFDYFEDGITNSIQVAFQEGVGEIEYSFGVTLQDVGTVPVDKLLLIDPTQGGSMEHATTPQLSYWFYPYRYGAVFISNASNPTNAEGYLHGIIINSGNGRG